MGHVGYVGRWRERCADGDGAVAAARLIGAMPEGRALCVLSRGAFDLLDVIEAALGLAGPGADLDLGCWTINRFGLARLTAWRAEGRVRALRWLLDREFRSVRQGREYLGEILGTFGPGGVRPMVLHAKFATVVSATAAIAILSTANPNKNLRAELHWIAADAGLVAELRARVAEWFTDPDLADAWGQPDSWHRAKFEAWHAAARPEAPAPAAPIVHALEASGVAEDARFFGDGLLDVDLRRRGFSFWH